jgi:hypothetical protein
MLYFFALAATQSSALMTLLVRPEPSASRTFRLTSDAPGATPLKPSPSPAMMPAMCVPCPSLSSPVPFGPVKSRHAVIFDFTA